MGDWKLLLNASERDAEESADDEKSTGSVELYNLAADVAESKNLAPSDPERVKQMRARLAELQKDAVAPGGGSAAGPAPAKRAK
jgi:hypothetical protein